MNGEGCEGEGSVTRSISSAIKASGSDEERFSLQIILKSSLFDVSINEKKSVTEPRWSEREKTANCHVKVPISNVWALILLWKFNILQLMEKYLKFYKEKP